MKLFSRHTLGPVSLKNRVVMAPMTRCRATADHVPTPIMAEYYGTRASAGLIITEGVAPSPSGAGYARIPGLYDEAQVAAWRTIADAVHANDGVLAVQLMHCGRVAHPLNLPPGVGIVAPSPVALAGEMYTDQAGMQPHPVPRQLTENDIQALLDQFVRAAVNARRAGIDFVELHGANGYLITQFLAPNTNRRSDAWGGPFSSRARFCLEVAKRCADAIGGDRLGIRLSPFGAFNAIEADPKEADNYVWLAAELRKLGLGYLHFSDQSGGGGIAITDNVLTRIREAFGGTFILSGGYDVNRAETDLTRNLGDLVAFGRPFIANSDLVERYQRGLPVAAPDASTFYTPGPVGYTDYPRTAL